MRIKNLFKRLSEWLFGGSRKGALKTKLERLHKEQKRKQEEVKKAKKFKNP